MNFQELKNVEDYKSYLDTAFSRARKKAGEKKQKKYRDSLAGAKDKEITRVEAVNEYLSKALSTIEKSFPSIDSLPNFYYELCRLHFDTDELKKALSAIPWAESKIKELSAETKKNIKISDTPDSAKKYRNAFYGRVDSIMRKIRRRLETIEIARREMKGFPSVKEKVPTIAVVGFPNVGKSTLISDLSGSELEINSYSFTTKRLLVGYAKKGYERIQLIDTPGSLNRDKKMNNIEKQAELAMEHVADAMIYVFDPTEIYPIEKQEKLLKKTIKEYHKETIIYISKTDIADEIIVNEIKERHKEAITDKERLKEEMWKLDIKKEEGI